MAEPNDNKRTDDQWRAIQQENDPSTATKDSSSEKRKGNNDGETSKEKTNYEHVSNNTRHSDEH